MRYMIHALAISVAMLAPSTAFAAQSIIFSGTTETSVDLYKVQEIDPSFVLKSVSYDITFAFTQNFANNEFSPFTFSYQGYAGVSPFGGSSFSGEATTSGPGVTGVSYTYNARGVMTDNLAAFNGTGKLPLSLIGSASSADGRVRQYGGRQVATYRIVYEVDSVSPVPEPKAWLLMLTGFALLGGALRYRRRSMKGLASY